MTTTGVCRGQVSRFWASCGLTTPCGIGNRVAVRIGFRPSEHLVHPIDQPIGDDVLQELGFVVHLVPAEAHDLHQEQLDEPMTPQDERRELLAGGGQRDTGIGLVLDEPRLGEGFHHRRGRARRDTQRRGELSHRQQALGRGQGGGAQVDGLQVVLDSAGRKHLAASVSEFLL